MHSVLDVFRLAPTGCPSEREAGLVATRNAIRRAIACEERWRRRGGVVILLALLSKAQPKDAVAPTNQGATTTVPACHSSSGDIPLTLAHIFEEERDSCAGAGCCGPEAKRGRPVVLPYYGSKNSRDTIGEGETSGRKCLLEEGEEEEKGNSEGKGGTDDELVSALAGLLDLGWANGDLFCLFRKIVRYL